MRCGGFIPSARRRAAVLLLVLWMMIILGVVGFSYTSSVGTQVNAMRVARGRVEALWAARAGVERARVLLSQIDLAMLNADAQIFDDPELFMDQPVGQALFSLMAPTLDPSRPVRYGVRDACAMVDINAASEEQMQRLPGVTQEMIDCLLDWRDEDADVRTLGAEDPYYIELENPYPARDANLLDVRELLRVRGWEAVFMLAGDDPYARFSGRQPASAAPMDPEQARLLLSMLTTWSMDADIAPDGGPRLSLQSTSAEEMTERAGLTDEEARAVVAWRRNNPFESPIDLINVQRPGENDENNADGRQQQQQQSDGDRIFSLRRVGEIIDYFNAGQQNGSGQTGGRQGRININTAPFEVLMTVPGMTESIADGIIGLRGQEVLKPGRLAELPGIDETLFRELYPYFTIASSRFVVWSRGAEPDSGVTVDIEAVLEVSGAGEVRVVHWRET